MQFLGGEERKFFAQIKPRLRTKDRQCACAGAIGAGLTFFEDEPEKILAIRVRYAFADGAGNAAGLAVYVKAPGETEFQRAEVAAVPPNFLKLSANTCCSDLAYGLPSWMVAAVVTFN